MAFSVARRRVSNSLARRLPSNLWISVASSEQQWQHGAAMPTLDNLVVLAMGVRPDRPDYEALREAYGDKLILVGDSCRPGQIYDALHSGHDKAFVY